MNWLMPWAPTGELAFGFHPDSASICAAIRGAVISGHMDPAWLTYWAYSGGTFAATLLPTVLSC